MIKKGPIDKVNVEIGVPLFLLGLSRSLLGTFVIFLATFFVLRPSRAAAGATLASLVLVRYDFTFQEQLH